MDFFKRVWGRTEAGRETVASPLEAFDKAKNLAGEIHSRQLVLIRPDLSLLALACPDADGMPGDVIRQVESIVPSTVKRNIAVVTETGFAPAGSRTEAGSAAWTAVGKDLPFFGLLNGLGSIGHTVWIFDVTADLGIACRDADILIIDSAVSDRVPESSLGVAGGAMRSRNILVHDRETYTLKPVAATWDAIFDEARTRTKGGEQCRIVVVQADRSLMCVASIPRKAMTQDHLAQAHGAIPEGVPRNVAAIASTQFVPDPADSQAPAAVAQLRAAGRAIPFFGLLLNLASAGNPTWIFDGSPETLTPGCRNADLLFIDSALSDRIPVKALDQAAGVMRSANMAVYDRKSRRIALLRSLGGSMDKLVFRD